MRIKKFTIILWITFAILIFTFCKKTEDEIDGWSSYQGELKWNEANKKCADLGMRLPTKEEWHDSYKKGLFKSWEQRTYLTSNIYEENTVYTFSLYLGTSKKTFKDNLTSTRCIK